MKPVTVTFDADEWQVVPKKATAEMLNRGAKFSLTLAEAYEDMLSVAPQPPAVSAEPVAWKTFNEWMHWNMPSGTIVGEPGWWASRIYRKFIEKPTPNADAKDAEMLRDLEIPFLADLLTASIANLGYPVGCGIPLSQEHAKKAATALFDRFVSLANAMQKGAVSTDTKDAPLKLAREALKAAIGWVPDHTLDTKIREAIASIDAAMQKGGA